MVADSRASLRRSTLRGHKSSPSRSPPLHDTAPPPFLSPSRESRVTLRSKRVRTSTLSEPDHGLKRRRLSTVTKVEPPLQIPLRSRRPPSQVRSSPATASTTKPGPIPFKLPPHSPRNGALGSPGERSQYDQIRIIEEKAKASIRGGSTSSAPDDRRKLRSDDGGSRAKTELAQYFPDFEDMLSLKAPDPEALTTRTKIVLIDDTPDWAPAAPRDDPFGTHGPLHKTDIIQLNRRGVVTDAAAADPLGDAAYLKIHGKAERHEKQMKNGDREKAQHEKYQLEKLLEDLRGPDWLKTLGITGVTETEKKKYEPKRILFIRETQGLIDKFKRWKEEEKRRKLERDQALLEEAMAEDDTDDDDDGGESSGADEDGDDDDDDSQDNEVGQAEVDDSEETSSSNDGASIETASTQAPNSSELDALASRQLIEEHKIASRSKKAPPPVPVPVAEPPAREFVSFFAKRHLRDAALAGRQRGRTILAFGYPVPDVADKEFELPPDILTAEAIKASERSRRRSRRASGD